MATLFPSPKKKLTVVTDYTRCIKCQIHQKDTSEALHNVTHASYRTLVTVLNARTDDTSERLHADIQSEEEFFKRHPKWHNSCRGTWTSRSNFIAGGQSYASAQFRLTRSHSDEFDFKSMCILCGVEKLPGKKKHERLSRVETTSVQKTIFDNVVRCDDQTVLTRIIGDNDCSIDMIAAEARYHRTCYLNLANKAKTKDSSKDVNEFDAAFELLIGEIEDSLFAGKLYHLTSVTDIYRNHLVAVGLDEERASVYRNDNMKKRLQSYFGVNISFIPQSGPFSEIICHAKMSAANLIKSWTELKCDVDENYVRLESDNVADDESFHDGSDVFDAKMTYRFAQKLKSDIKQIV